jgi:hypothetical protein
MSWVYRIHTTQTKSDTIIGYWVDDSQNIQTLQLYIKRYADYTLVDQAEAEEDKENSSDTYSATTGEIHITREQVSITSRL